jgi:transcription elongation factor/antiterminator RfaH
MNEASSPDLRLSRSVHVVLCGGDRWYVVYTQPHKEVQVQYELAKQGFNTFLPKLRRTVRHARRRETKSTPFFPRYLFVALHLGRDRWRSVNGTNGVVRLVSAGEAPTAMPSGIIEAMAARCDANGHLNLDESLSVGDRVRVLSGPFADLVGELACIDDETRVRVLIDILGGKIPVSIERGMLVPEFAA